jgi:hypothetical protein
MAFSVFALNVLKVPSIRALSEITLYLSPALKTGKVQAKGY